ncbi:MAG: DHH family phosphoesterase [Myxococcaceae bacterium]
MSASVRPLGVDLAGLAPREKLDALLGMARGKRQALVLTHDNPDPDSIASALALAALLEERANVPTRVSFGGIIGRAENTSLVNTLSLQLAPVSQIVFDEYDLIALVDTQPMVGNHSLPARVLPPDIVIDHHPLREETLLAPFADVGGDYGATSTMLVEYLRAARIDPSPDLATALFYGIKADTRDLGRETTGSDVDAYLWLFPRADKGQLARIEHPELPLRYFRLYHKAIERAVVYRNVVVTDLGEVYAPDMVAEVAERMSSLQGRKWSIALGTFRHQLYLSIRTRDRRMNAGKLTRDICADQGGSAGGHGSMAGARIPLAGSSAERSAKKRAILRRFLEGFGVGRQRPQPLLTAEEP